MNLKELIYLMPLAALLFMTTACQQDEDPTLGKTKVTFIAHLPETYDSRAIGDGSKANELYFWVYDEQDQEYVDLRRHGVEFDQTTNTSRVSAYLTPGHVYKFAFWAQRAGTTAYTPGASSLIPINYNGLCNDELRDAFWGWIPDLEVNVAGELEQDIVLTRRLAQLNVGISPRGYQNAKTAGIDLKEYDSKITIQRNVVAAYTAFELKGGEPPYNNRRYQRPTITFDFAPMPDELLSAENKYWVYLALNYFQPSVAQQFLVNVTMVLRHRETGHLITFNFPNIPVRGTERTNILIDDIVEDVDFNVEIDENFDNMDYNVNYDPIGD